MCRLWPWIMEIFRAAPECSTTQRSLPPSENSNRHFGSASFKTYKYRGAASRRQYCLQQPILQRRREGTKKSKMVSCWFQIHQNGRSRFLKEEFTATLFFLCRYVVLGSRENLLFKRLCSYV